jgi:hypothetical protein
MQNPRFGTWLRCSGIIRRSFKLSGTVVSNRRVRFQNADVAAVFANYPADVRARLLWLRELILETAAATAGVGILEETLRWGEPSYLTTQSKSGSLIRIHWKPSDSGHYRMYFHCQTNLVATFRALYPTQLTYDGNRSIALRRNEGAPLDVLRHCIALALTYHATRKARNASR